ncbi:MAG: GNAT family N-acetyltransferase [Bryobacterales bacterium]|nr:GNAT family N-acetyltransferase [Bryobacterales bacterium]
MICRIRRAIREDAEFLAWVMLASSRSHLTRGIWEVIIGADEAGCLDYLRRLAIAEPRSLYHYESFLVAEAAGERAAALCGFEPRHDWATVGEAMSNVQRDLGWTAAETTASYTRIAPVWASCMPANAGADFVIENVATTPKYRRRGVVRALIDQILRDAVEHGGRMAQITTYIGNDAAQSAYEKSGFRVSDEKRCTELENLLGVPGFVRLTRELIV